jgi:neutral ceramidase
VRVGHGRAPLPVPDGTRMGGYAARVGGAAGMLDPLGVDCVSIAGDDGRLVLVVAEILCVDRALAAAVRERVGAAVTGDAWVCATHTHSGPEVGGLDAPAPLAWCQAVAETAAAAAAEAVRAERELGGRLHTGVLAGVASPRGDDAAEPRVTVDVVACTGADGRVRGVLAVLPIHPTVLPASSNLISGDLAGAIRTALAREFEWAVVVTGAAGDISTRRTRRAQTPAECRRLAKLAAEQLSALVRGAGEAAWDTSGGRIASARGSIALPAHRRDQTELRVLRERVEAAHGEARDAAEVRTLETALQGIAIAERAPDASRDVPIELAAARVGRLQLFAVGAEPFHSFADALRPAVCLGYANGHAGYLPDAAAYETPGYEVLASALPRDAVERTLAALTELLPEPQRRTE